ncbi:secreted protein [Legionella busanensis]|uniref:Secreted protein n=1 Tax=Legionella busanensis TaxID=190655 RepID=A0A378JGF0_9GAMM|nr:RimK/LysX family protein [Legionella busanensis]STX50067.1 secreted protein [Legionella busanensis]
MRSVKVELTLTREEEMKLSTLLILVCIIFSGHTMAGENKIIYGYVEKAILVDKNLPLSAKLDTGAKSASLSAIHIQQVEKNNKIYLSFLIPTKEGDIPFLAEYLGNVKIKVRAGENLKSKKEPLNRPVVLVRIRIGDRERAIPVNLANRKRFLYPLLLGRDAIKAFSGLVDPSTTFTIKPVLNNNEIK